MKFCIGDRIKSFFVESLTGTKIRIPDPDGKMTYVRFLRWAGCSICNLQLGEFRHRAAEIKAAGMRVVIIFHSSETDVREFHESLSFDLVADPKKHYYHKFAVGSSPLFLVHPRTLRTWLISLKGVESNLKMTNGPLGLPADFLIRWDGTVGAVKYGRRADDSWSVNELLELSGELQQSQSI